MKKIMLLGCLTIVAVIGSLAHAESYATYVDTGTSNAVTLTISNVKAVVNNMNVVIGTKQEAYITDVTLNGKAIAIESAAFDREKGSIKVISTSGKVILDIPATSIKGEWSMRQKERFSNGDTRAISGDLTINGKKVAKLYEISELE